MSRREVFICYRREDSSPYAGRLTDALRRQLGEEKVFLDTGSPPGVDFRNHIEDTIGSCAVLIAVIGPTWLTVQDESGRRRIDDPHDLLALEIAAALERDKRVIPVLVAGAQMPREVDLPKLLARLAYRTALTLSDAGWDRDVSGLVEALNQLLGCGSDTGARVAQPTVPPMAIGVRQNHLDEIDRCIAGGTHVVIGGAPGIGRTGLLNALHKAYPHAVHVRLEQGKTESMRELRLALHGHHGIREFPLDNAAGIDELRRALPANTLLLVDNADERASVAAVLRLVRSVEKVTVVVTSRRAQEFPGFRRLTLLRIPRPDAEAVVSEYELVGSHVHRREKLVILGGDACCDLGGMLALLYVRGTDYAIVATSSMAQLDAATGGEAGCDAWVWKSLLGGFRQPELVLIDPSLFRILPPCHLRARAEALKLGLLLSELGIMSAATRRATPTSEPDPADGTM